MQYENRIKEIEELKHKIDKHMPLSKHALEQLKGYYRIGLTYASNAIEGNSLTETETKIVIEDGITIGGKPLKDHYEAIGHSEAFSFLYDLAKNKTIKEADILKLHHLFYYRIDEDNAGKYRKVNVLITGSTFKPPAHSEVPALMKKFTGNIPAMQKKYHPVEFSARIHKELVTIHPFVDGNGRAARLLMNLALLQSGYVITIIPPILRNDYINAIKKAQVEPKDDKPFINFISSMVYESAKEYIRLLESL
ncbi:MAG: Fic family protein [Candidatus Omnitrophica bacterium]|nr:Fic family protein [Candidatus Omnitrophota bacterium]MBU4479038.1 Fic family protein [Candidatus Omnitrophota bacterium]MCG2703523.1 Fic family protein [Candidatus Omnitrophota bacterium]